MKLFLGLALVLLTSAVAKADGACWNRQGPAKYYFETENLCFAKVELRGTEDKQEIFLQNDDVYGTFPVIATYEKGGLKYYVAEGAYQSWGVKGTCTEYLRSRVIFTLAVETTDQYETRYNFNKSSVKVLYTYNPNDCKLHDVYNIVYYANITR